MKNDKTKDPETIIATGAASAIDEIAAKYNELAAKAGATPIDVRAVLTKKLRDEQIERLRSDLTDRLAVVEIEAMRKELGLPPEALAWMVDRMDKIAQATAISRQVLPMNTKGERIPPGKTAAISNRPQRIAFRPERVFVSNARPDYHGPWIKRLWPWYKPPATRGAGDFLIHDITIGNRSQLCQGGAIPGDMFATEAIDAFVTFETAQTAMEIVMMVEYVGPDPKGCPFYGSIIGMAA